MILGPYGGPGGWAEGLAAHGRTETGIEWDPDACRTRTAAGHRTIRADVTRFPLAHLAGRVEGVCISPPCPAFSSAGKGEGRRLLGALGDAIRRHAWTAPFPPGVCDVLEVGRWVTVLRPRWLVAEQVPPVLPLWREYVSVLRSLGYSAWAGKLDTADYGVPQNRERAVLVASLDRVARAPTPTHAEPGGESTLFGGLAPWVSMAAALGWTGQDTPARTLCGDRAPRWMYPDSDGTHGRVVVVAGNQVNATVRGVHLPAPTVAFGHTSWTFELHTNRGQAPDGSRQVRATSAPAPALTAKAGGQWVFDRPATTVCGDPRLSGPGRTDPDVPGSQYGENSVRLTIVDALILQGFRPDYPLQGTKTAQFQQVGNAVCPPLAARILEVLV